MITENVVAWYWTIVFMVFIYWLMLFSEDHSTPNNDAISWIFLLIAPLFWPIILPISSLELSHKAINNMVV